MENNEKHFEAKLSKDLREVWDLSGDISISEEPNTDGAWARLVCVIGETKTVRPTVSTPLWGRVFATPKPAFVAALSLVFIVSLPFIYTSLTTESYTVPKGEVLSHVLPDGSEIRLNAGSSFSYRTSFGDKVREINLEGEAYFDVIKSEMPFVVQTEDVTVTVLGTEFNVTSWDGWIEVAVNEGIVSVKNSVTDDEKPILVKAGNRTKFSSSMSVETPELIAYSQYPGWIHDKLIFENSNFMTVCKEIERKFDISINLKNNELEEIEISGVVDADNVQTVLSTLTKLTQRSYKFENNQYIFY
tara:strand:+ start:9424 stop:10329 length:906 start_codon:yes stop_codon:yes gene_type:complete